MWPNRAVFGALSLVCVTLCLEYKFAILPIHGIYLLVYLFVITISTSWVTFTCLHKLLQTNKPFKYDAPFVKSILLYLNKCSEGKPVPNLHSNRPNLDVRLDDFVKDVEARFILKWYAYVSDDPAFPSEVKILLDEIVRHFLQVIVYVDNKKLFYAITIVVLKHVKEFRRTVRRSVKGNIPVEDLYRYSHLASKSDKASAHFYQQVTTNLLHQFINWELRNSLPCRTLISILSRRLTNYAVTFLSAPGYLNRQIAGFFCPDKLRLDNYAFISISDVDHTGSFKEKKARKVEDETPKASPKRPADKLDLVDSSVKTGVERAPDLVLNTKTESRPKASEPVKIYESRSSTKTWHNSSDLECISLGQDLLAFQEFNPNAQIQELIDKKLWKDNTVEDERPSSMWDIPESWYGEEELLEAETSSQIQNYIKSNVPTAAIITSTMKPIGNVTANTLHNMKELQQTTVNTVTNVVKPVSVATTNAMHKIGDLQDEAAGVVEGILDFGMAGLRKGLRLTGLQENFTELTQKAKNEFHTHKLEAQKTIDLQGPIHKITEAIKIIDNKRVEPKIVKIEQSSSESDESVWVNPLDIGSPSFEGEILLEKTPDSLPQSAGPFLDLPQITEECSPDLEYEEVQDFASTIAKLRCLLQQRSSESSFTTPSLSPMPQEDAVKTPADTGNDLLKVGDGATSSLYKLCARTATGVFQNTLNTIKTALPGNTNEASRSLGRCGSDDWTFVEADSGNDDFDSRMQRLLTERRAYCTVDTAYEAIDSLEIVDKTDFAWTPPTCPFEDDMDEFDLQIPITKALADIICELMGDSYTIRESVIKAVLLLIGNYIETTMDEKSESFLHLPNKCIGKLPEIGEQNALPMKLEELVKVCTEALPDALKAVLGQNAIEKAVGVFISSLQSPRINRDVFMQILEIFSMHLISACGQNSPAYSA